MHDPESPPTLRYPILYVDDEPGALATFENNFRREFIVRTAQTGSDALRMVEAEPIAVLVADQRMPEMHGVEVIERARQLRPSVVPIILTGYTDPESLKEAINRAGAFRYLEKPWRKEELGHAIRRALEHHHLAVENVRLTQELREANEQLQVRNAALTSENAGLRREARVSHELVGETAAVSQLRERIARAAPHRTTVLILGETGTGKGVVARAIHAASPRRERPMETLNCANIPKELVESELFGHQKGAFTGAIGNRPGCFAVADGSTLLLDEIGTLPLDVQPKLLRVLEDGEIQPVGSGRTQKVDVRVIAATNVDLSAAVRAGTFREDLFFRLNIVPITVAPLRERRGDIPVLARHFLELESQALYGRPAPAITDAALRLFAAYDYPGNVRDLRNRIIRVLINSPGVDTLTEAEFQEYLDQPVATGHDTVDGSYRERRDAAERRIIEDALARSGQNKRQAARDLGLSEPGLHKAMRRLRMTTGDGTDPA